MWFISFDTFVTFVPNELTFEWQEVKFKYTGPSGTKDKYQIWTEEHLDGSEGKWYLRIDSKDIPKKLKGEFRNIFYDMSELPNKDICVFS